MKLKSIVTLLVAAVLLAAGSAGAWSLADLLHKSGPTTRDSATAGAATSVATATPTAATAAVPIPATGGSAPNYRAIVQANSAAVVGVTVAGTRKVGNFDSLPNLPDDPFFQFFRGLPGWQRIPQQGAPFRGQGSGFVVGNDGTILTNAHVVRDAKEVNVKLSDRREFRAKVLGSDPATDVAVLKVEAGQLPSVTIGDPQQVQVGDYVLAIGAPFGFEQTATQGIVSAKGRSLPGDSFVPFIQTDAAVNPGNSGGPLFDASGRVIGINAQIYSQNGGFQGLAFAIPIDVALRVKDQIVSKGHVDHARMGVLLQDLTQPLADSFGLKTPDGAVVSSVEPDSAAAKAGLKAGDVIIAVDSQNVHTAGDVSSRVGMAAPGDRVQLTLWRDKSSREVALKLGHAESDATQSADATEHPSTLGLAVRPLSLEERKQMQVDHGLMVEQVEGPAARAGIEPGDVVLALNGEAVTRVEQIRRVLQSHPKHVALLIQHDGQQIFVPVNLV